MSGNPDFTYKLLGPKLAPAETFRRSGQAHLNLLVFYETPPRPGQHPATAERNRRERQAAEVARALLKTAGFETARHVWLSNGDRDEALCINPDDQAARELAEQFARNFEQHGLVSLEPLPVGIRLYEQATGYVFGRVEAGRWEFLPEMWHGALAPPFPLTFSDEQAQQTSGYSMRPVWKE